MFVIKYILLDVFLWTTTNDHEIPYVCLLLNRVDFTVLCYILIAAF